ncbi:MAG: peroxiredoxin [Vicinamibacteria bacterium]
MLGAGDVAPDFESVDQDGHAFRLSSLRGRWAILYFYPKDETTGCTAEACAFRDNLEAFRALGTEVVGVSTQDRESHRRFAQRHGLNFRLVADPDKRIARAFGALGFLGLAKRVSFLVDGDGRIRDAYRSEISPTSHVDHARQKLREFGVGV